MLMSEWDASKPIGKGRGGVARINRETAEAFRAKSQEADRQSLQFGGWPGPRPILATLSGSTSPYSWTEVVPDGTTFHSTPRTGTADAYEVNGVAGLGGKRATIRPGRGDWRFQASKVGEPSEDCTATVCVTIECAPSAEAGAGPEGSFTVKHDDVVIGSGDLERTTVSSTRWFLTGCSTVDLTDIPLPATITLTVTTPGGYEVTQEAEITDCGESVSVEFSEGLSGLFRLRFAPANPTSVPVCSAPAYFTGMTFDFIVEESDDGISWDSMGGGSVTFTHPTPAIFYQTRPTKSILRVSGTAYPPPGWRAFGPNTFTATQSGLNTNSCVTSDMFVVATLLFDSTNYVMTNCGPIPKVLCWSGNAECELHYQDPPVGCRTGDMPACAPAGSSATLHSWAGTEVFTAPARSTAVPPGGDPCGPGSEIDAAISARVSVCFLDFTDCRHGWVGLRTVKGCDFAPGNDCPGLEGNREWHLNRDAGFPLGVFNLYGRGFGDSAEACWGQIEPSPSHGITFYANVDSGFPDACNHPSHGRCHAPPEAYTPGTLSECGGGGFMMAAALPPEPKPEPPPLAPDDPARPENRKPFREVHKAAESAGCGKRIPVELRKGCGCSFECLRGHSPLADGGVTLLDCWRCPERPGVSASTD
jgi:hypothetical protein